MPGIVRLAATGGPLQGQELVFDGHDVLVFGRDGDERAVLPDDDPTASRHHFLLEVNPPDVCVRDLGSLNGTWVNGRKCGSRSPGETPEEGRLRDYPHVALRDGDEIRAGAHAFRVGVEVAALCHECGAAIGDEVRDRCAWVGDTFWCEDCRQRAAAANRPAAPEPPRCEQCGKDVAAELGDGRGGAYVCASCRAQAVADPNGALSRILRAAAAAKREAAPGALMAEGLWVAEYEVVRTLGVGGFGTVCVARRGRDGALVALKMLQPKVAVDRATQQRFEREISILAELRHPNIVELLEWGTFQGADFFAMELCEGGDVVGLLEREGKLSLARAAPLMLEVLDGLAYAHERGFVHRDLKPPNVLLSPTSPGPGDGPTRAKVGDFGLARSFLSTGKSGITLGESIGTYEWMPAEQYYDFRNVKPTTDVFSIAATFYAMLTRAPPRQPDAKRDPIQIVLQDRAVPIREREPRIPTAVASVIDQALARDPAVRPRDAGELRRALAPLL